MNATITENVIWTSESNEHRVILRAKNNRYYPQRYIVGEHGPDWYYLPEFKGYKSLRGAMRPLKEAEETERKENRIVQFAINAVGREVTAIQDWMEANYHSSYNDRTIRQIIERLYR